MHPLTVGEGGLVKPPPEKYWEENFSENFSWKELLKFGGFPEPLFMQNEAKVQRWQRLYRERLIKEDLRDLQEVRDIRVTDSIIYYQKLLKPNFCIQVIKDEKEFKKSSMKHPNIQILSAKEFLGSLV